MVRRTSKVMALSASVLFATIATGRWPRQHPDMSR